MSLVFCFSFLTFLHIVQSLYLLYIYRAAAMFSYFEERGLFQEAGLLSNQDYFAEETQNPFKSGTWTYQ